MPTMHRSLLTIPKRAAPATGGWISLFSTSKGSSPNLPPNPLPSLANPIRRAQAAKIGSGMIKKVRKAVFPAAGLGTRFLPATKAMPKEMLPLVYKPLIQYGVEEAIHSGISNMIIGTGRGKTAIQDHFHVSFAPGQQLESRGKQALLSVVRELADMLDVSYIPQKEALG